MMQKSNHKKPSSADVAALAGVSRATVSRAFSPTYNLDATLKARVLQAADTLGYRPNAIARSLNTQRTNIVGIALRNTSNPFYAAALDCLIHALQEAGFQSLVFVPKDNNDIDTVLEKALQYQVDAIIIFSTVQNSKLVDAFIARDIPTILFNRYIENSGASSVCLNDLYMGRQVAQRLYDAGHRHFCFISGDESASTVMNRKVGFLMQLQDLGVQNCHVIAGGMSYESGERSAAHMLAAHPAVDACFVCCDQSAFGVMDYLRLVAHKRIPEDIAVVGFDDLPMAANVHYQLSTVRQPWALLVNATVDAVRERIANRTAPPISRVLEGEYVVRRSTR